MVCLYVCLCFLFVSLLFTSRFKLFSGAMIKLKNVCFLVLSCIKYSWLKEVRLVKTVMSNLFYPFNMCQDSDENWSGVSEGRPAVVLRQRSRRPGEDSGEPEARSVHPQQRAATRCHSDHQLHHLCPAARPLLPVRTYWTEHVRRRPHMCVLTFVVHIANEWG